MNFCPKCGTRRVADLPFCGSCGIDFRELAPEAPRRHGRHRRRTLLAVLALAAIASSVGLAACGSSAASQPAASAAGSMGHSTVRATPEDAVKQYLAGVAATDITKVLDACAVKEAAAHFDFAYQAERLNVIVPSTFLLPSEYRFYVDINVYGQASRIVGQIRGLEFSLLSGKPVSEALVGLSADDVKKYVKDVDPSRLSSLTVVDVKYPLASLASNTKNLDNFAKMARAYGADEMTERVALVQWNGGHFVVGFQLIRYGTDWLVLGQTSSLFGTPADGSAEATTPDDFAAAVAK